MAEIEAKDIWEAQEVYKKLKIKCDGANQEPKGIPESYPKVSTIPVNDWVYDTWKGSVEYKLVDTKYGWNNIEYDTKEAAINVKNNEIEANAQKYDKKHEETADVLRDYMELERIIGILKKDLENDKKEIEAIEKRLEKASSDFKIIAGNYSKIDIKGVLQIEPSNLQNNNNKLVSYIPAKTDKKYIDDRIQEYIDLDTQCLKDIESLNNSANKYRNNAKKQREMKE